MYTTGAWNSQYKEIVDLDPYLCDNSVRITKGRDCFYDDLVAIFTIVVSLRLFRKSPVPLGGPNQSKHRFVHEYLKMLVRDMSTH